MMPKPFITAAVFLSLTLYFLIPTMTINVSLEGERIKDRWTSSILDLQAMPAEHARKYVVLLKVELY